MYKKWIKKWIKSDLKNRNFINLYMSLKNFTCEKCNKCYSSYKSLWNHNKKYHKNEDNDEVSESKDDRKEKVRKSKDKINNENESILIDKKYVYNHLKYIVFIIGLFKKIFIIFIINKYYKWKVHIIEK
jgi:hypothetical protein